MAELLPFTVEDADLDQICQFWYEPRRTRSVLVDAIDWNTGRNKTSLERVTWPDVVFCTQHELREPNPDIASSLLVYPVERRPTDVRDRVVYDMSRGTFAMIYGVICLGDEALVTVSRGLISAPDAFWMTAFAPRDLPNWERVIELPAATLSLSDIGLFYPYPELSHGSYSLQCEIRRQRELTF